MIGSRAEILASRAQGPAGRSVRSEQGRGLVALVILSSRLTLPGNADPAARKLQTRACSDVVMFAATISDGAVNLRAKTLLAWCMQSEGDSM